MVLSEKDQKYAPIGSEYFHEGNGLIPRVHIRESRSQRHVAAIVVSCFPRVDTVTRRETNEYSRFIHVLRRYSSHPPQICLSSPVQLLVQWSDSPCLSTFHSMSVHWHSWLFRSPILYTGEHYSSLLVGTNILVNFIRVFVGTGGFLRTQAGRFSIWR